MTTGRINQVTILRLSHPEGCEAKPPKRRLELLTWVRECSERTLPNL